MKAIFRINRFYYVFGVVLLVLSILVIVSLRSIFSALKVSGEVDDSLLDVSLPRINKDRISQAIDSVTNREIQKLDLKQ